MCTMHDPGNYNFLTWNIWRVFDWLCVTAQVLSHRPSSHKNSKVISLGNSWFLSTRLSFRAEILTSCRCITVPYTKIAITITFWVCWKHWLYKSKGTKDEFWNYFALARAEEIMLKHVMTCWWHQVWLLDSIVRTEGENWSSLTECVRLGNANTKKTSGAMSSASALLNWASASCSLETALMWRT